MENRLLAVGGCGVVDDMNKNDDDAEDEEDTEIVVRCG
jgi:hypothetical protein